mgnify:CR=1 FL=1
MKHQVKLKPGVQRRAVLARARRGPQSKGNPSIEDLETRITELEEAIEALVSHLGLGEADF